MFCSRCGNQIHDQAYCSGCGAARPNLRAPTSVGLVTHTAAPRNPVNAAAPSYGHFVEETAEQTTITVPVRRRPGADIFALKVVLSCIFVPVCFFACAMFSQSVFSALQAGVIINVIVLGLLLGGDLLRRGERAITYGQAVIAIQRRQIHVNGTGYDRVHIKEWSTRWTEVGSAVIVGSYSYVAGAKIDHALKQREALQSYQITFDYGDRVIMAVGGLTQSTAARIMETIQGALDRLY